MAALPEHFSLDAADAEASGMLQETLLIGRSALLSLQVLQWPLLAESVQALPAEALGSVTAAAAGGQTLADELPGPSVQVAQVSDLGTRPGSRPSLATRCKACCLKASISWAVLYLR